MTVIADLGITVISESNTQCSYDGDLMGNWESVMTALLTKKTGWKVGVSVTHTGKSSLGG